MSRTYRFRFRLPGGRGGLAADLTAAARPAPSPDEPGALRLHRGIVLGVPGGTYWEDAAWLAFGASLSAPALAEAHPDGLLIAVHALDHPLADYRPEVAALAIDAWLHAEFTLPPTGAGVTASATGPVFTWGAGRPPFA
ncbi:hypothetical protein ACL02R_03155 [Streptomyces sp. MS19]|uniref:hypothetical protein n=1 Tax=Streptomyces sp. MS19 TaxID=3385972 RepID=UPI00399FB022